jgi:putative transposase
LIKSIAEFAGVEIKELCQRGRTTKVAAVKSIICYLACRRIGYSGETIAKALGITRSGVCRGASRGAALVAQNRDKWGDVVEIINKSTTSP